jgi:hypothetical protein
VTVGSENSEGARMNALLSPIPVTAVEIDVQRNRTTVETSS